VLLVWNKPRGAASFDYLCRGSAILAENPQPPAPQFAKSQIKGLNFQRTAGLVLLVFAGLLLRLITTLRK